MAGLSSELLLSPKSPVQLDGPEEVKGQPKVVFVDIECLFDKDEVALSKYSETGKPIPFTPAERTCYRLQDNFQGKKTRSAICAIFREPGFWKGLKPLNFAQHAMHSLVAGEWDVKIVISTTVGNLEVISEQMEWISEYLGAQWLNRVITCADKTLLQGLYLIDTQSFPEAQTIRLLDEKSEGVFPIANRTPFWLHILFSAPHNQDDKTKPRLDSWKGWKELLDALEQPGTPSTNSVGSFSPGPTPRDVQLASPRKVPSYRHGSEDSKDEDRLYLFEKMPPNKACLQFVNGLSSDANIITVKEGIVNNCFRGLPDETHNGLLATFMLHPQDHSLPISETRIRRVVPLKAYLVSLVKLRRTQCREAIRAALSAADFAVMKKTLASFDFTELKLDVEELKYVAFQFGQTLALVEGRELYTKRTVYEHFPPLGPFIYREATGNLAVLNEFRDRLIKALREVSTEKKGEYTLFSAEPSATNFSALIQQCRGTVIHTPTLRVACLPFTYAAPTKQWACDWPRDSQTPERPEGGVFISLYATPKGPQWAGENAFNSPMTKILSKMMGKAVQRLNLDAYWYIIEMKSKSVLYPLKEGTPSIVGMRDRVTLELLPAERVAAANNELKRS